MADLIERQVAISDFEWCKSQAIDKDRWQEAIDRINALPSADAVDVVRCADCKHWDISDIHSTICPNNRRCKGIFGKMYTAPDYYCAYGERKDD